MKVFKRNAVIITVLLFVCVAVYLNWSYNKGEKDDVGAPVDDNNVQNVVGEDGAQDDGLFYTSGEDGSEDNSESVNSRVSEYFSSVRLSRQEARDNAAATLSVITESDSASQESVDTAMQQMLTMSEWMIKEAEIESMIIAKGFEDCVLFMSEEGVTVTIATPEEGLTSAAVAQIVEIITTQSAFAPADITISEIK